MADLINIRLTKDSPAVEAMDYAAHNLGMSRNEMILKSIGMILKSIGMMISFDKLFYKKLEGYSGKMNVSMAVAMQNMIIKRWAQDAAKTAVWGVNPEVLIEFSTTDVGTISPKDLHDMAYQMTFDAEAKEKIAVLKSEVAAGIPLRNEDDKVFYEKYRHKYSSVQREPDEDSFAYWESEMTLEEALEKFKGGKGNDKKK